MEGARHRCYSCSLPKGLVMALKYCGACDEWLKTKATDCPKCGFKLEKAGK